MYSLIIKYFKMKVNCFLGILLIFPVWHYVHHCSRSNESVLLNTWSESATCPEDLLASPASIFSVKVRMRKQTLRTRCLPYEYCATRRICVSAGRTPRKRMRSSNRLTNRLLGKKATDSSSCFNDCCLFVCDNSSCARGRESVHEMWQSTRYVVTQV